MSDRTTCEDLNSVTFLPASESGHSHCEKPDGQMIELFGQDPVLANLSARQAKQAGLMTSGIFGLPGTTSSSSANLTKCLANKLRVKTASLGSTLYKLTWKQRDTPGGAIDLCAAGVGAPHIRQRLWLAYTRAKRWERRLSGRPDTQWQTEHGQTGCGSTVIRLADAQRSCERWPESERSIESDSAQRGEGSSNHQSCSTTGRMANTEHHGCGRPETDTTQQSSDQQNIGVSDRGCSAFEGYGDPGPTNGFWRDADWLGCRDGKWRPVRPGTFPLANGAPARVGRLRGYGNAINAEAAAQFIKAYRQVTEEQET